MALTRVSAVVVWSVSAVVAAQSSPEPVPTQSDVTEREMRRTAPQPEDAERERLREVFIEARSEFAAVTAAALSSEELANWVRGLSTRVRLRRLDEDLRDVRASLRSLERSGEVGSERAQRLAERAAALESEADRLLSPDAATAPAAGGLLDQETVRRWLQKEMEEETHHLADTLTDRELERRTKRLRRLAALARLAGGLREQQRRPDPKADGDVNVIPAGGVESPAADVVVPADANEAVGEELLEDASLGEPTSVPPEFRELKPADDEAVESGD
ncbi:MAG: hypothetical protein M3552_11275 [Planctomycetota bacterium]|nr:hypothetical protein [Planctomycetaceae bacterium]MDQ3331218.1 hypothetical protein [Planctomycetota bacterium]